MSEEIDQKIARVEEKLAKFRVNATAARDKVVEREERLKLQVWRERAEKWEQKVAQAEHQLRRLEVKKAKAGNND